MDAIIKENKNEPVVPQAQKQFLANSIKEYTEKPELLIKENDAWKMINADD